MSAGAARAAGAAPRRRPGRPPAADAAAAARTAAKANSSRAAAATAPRRAPRATAAAGPAAPASRAAAATAPARAARPAAAGRTRPSVRASARGKDRLSFGVLCICIAGVLLTGVVGVNVLVLRQHVQLNKANAERTRLRADNAVLASQVSAAVSASRIEGLAERSLGLVAAEQEQTAYVDLGRVK